MGLLELFIISVGLSMDAFAVAISKGLSMKKMNYKYALITGCFFGGFQGLMPLIGFLLGTQFKDSITSVDHWIAFALLSIIGIKMFKESRNTEEKVDTSFSLKHMTILSIATSIDALAVGITFAFLRVNIVPAVIMIGVVTFIVSFIGVKIGNVFGSKYKARAEMIGGLILIGIGIKILVDHLGLI